MLYLYHALIAWGIVGIFSIVWMMVREEDAEAVTEFLARICIYWGMFCQALAIACAIYFVGGLLETIAR